MVEAGREPEKPEVAERAKEKAGKVTEAAGRVLNFESQTDGN